MKRVTPVLVVDEVEPCVDFWVKRFGFSIGALVDHEGRVGFAQLQRGKIELMYQSTASLVSDVPRLGVEAFRTLLFVEVPDIKELASRISDLDTVVPLRKTFYGSQEIGVRDPAGNPVIFASFQPES